MLKYNFESNSQREQDRTFHFGVGNYMLKYNFESNSQLINRTFAFPDCWELYAKVQF